MIVATPFLPAITDFENYASEIRRRGKLLRHTHVVISRLEDEEAAYAFSEKLSDLFYRTHQVTLADIPRVGHQLSVDFLRAALRFSYDYVIREGEQPDPAMLYMDPGYRPLKGGWLDTIQAEYYLRNAPLVFGRFDPPETAPRLVRGPVVFHKQFFKTSGLLPFVPNNSHWREYLQHEILNHAAETKLIGHGSIDSVLKAIKKP